MPNSFKMAKVFDESIFVGLKPVKGEDSYNAMKNYFTMQDVDLVRFEVEFVDNDNPHTEVSNRISQALIENGAELGERVYIEFGSEWL